ncbi:hypothetical protein H0264_29960 [Nocardia huaxiensis]|uniref:Uncharacterized protein n=1 Tax=Nocardia huaxiensis TaxID=2755382 RepID=A0A7D6VGZ9_9NOCA|nr:hypothetical protein [Nocardia huaxiensis]QLY29450.1 hypothetical protein H0264_29960 [Nocardia huaxiensis]
MIGTQTGKIAAAILVGTLTLLASGCSNDSDELQEIAKCGKLDFPEGAKLVDYDDRSAFNDQVLVAVVDMSAGQVEEFKGNSKLVRFEPGVPSDWKTQWGGTTGAEVLASGSDNEYLKEPYEGPLRNVAIHNSGGDARRVFINVAC